MNIACVYPTAPIVVDSTRSVPRLLAQMLDIMKRRSPNFRIHVLCPADKNNRDLSVVNVQIDTVDRVLRRVKSPNLSEKQIWVKKALDSLEDRGIVPSVVVCATVDAVLMCRQRLARSKIIYWIHSHPGYSGSLGGTQVSKAIESADFVVVPSRAMYHALWEICQGRGFTPPVLIIPNWVDTSRFCPPEDAAEKARFRDRFGFFANEIVIVHIGGSGNRRKGLQVVTTALNLFGSKKQKVVIASVGGDRVARRVVCKNLEVADLGILPPAELAQLYKASDLGIVPSVSFECFALAVLEMLASGLCVVSSNAGGTPELIENQQNGLLIDLPNDIQAWAATLDRCVMDASFRETIGKRAKQSVNRFSGENSFDLWQHLFQSLSVDS